MSFRKTSIAAAFLPGCGTRSSSQSRVHAIVPLLDLGYVDAFRSLHPEESGQFTFWDYFRQAFEHNRGIPYRSFPVGAGIGRSPGELRD